MRITKGRHKGKTGTVYQYANDWMAVDLGSGGDPVRVSPAHVRVDPGEHAIFENYALNGAAAVGTFWETWRLEGDAFVLITSLYRPPAEHGRPAGRSKHRTRTKLH